MCIWCVLHGQTLGGGKEEELPSSDTTFTLPLSYLQDGGETLDSVIDWDTVANLPETLAKEIPERLVPLKTTGDGNCLLHAVSRALWGVELYHDLLRKRLHQELTEHQEWYRRVASAEGQLFNDTDWSRILGNAARTGSYLEFMHTFALTNVLKRPILLYASDRDVETFGEGENGVAAMFLPARIGAEQCLKQRPVVLAWQNWRKNHYVPVVGIAGRNFVEWPRLKVAFPGALSALGVQMGVSNNGDSDGDVTSVESLFLHFEAPIVEPPLFRRLKMAEEQMKKRKEEERRSWMALAEMMRATQQTESERVEQEDEEQYQWLQQMIEAQATSPRMSSSNSKQSSSSPSFASSSSSAQEDSKERRRKAKGKEKEYEYEKEKQKETEEEEEMEDAVLLPGGSLLRTDEGLFQVPYGRNFMMTTSRRRQKEKQFDERAIEEQEEKPEEGGLLVTTGGHSKRQKRKDPTNKEQLLQMLNEFARKEKMRKEALSLLETLQGMLEESRKEEELAKQAKEKEKDKEKEQEPKREEQQEGSKKKKKYKGKEWDYAFKVNMGNGVKVITWNEGDHPIAVAQRFILLEGVGQEHLDRVVDFVTQNSRPIDVPSVTSASATTTSTSPAPTTPLPTCKHMPTLTSSALFPVVYNQGQHAGILKKTIQFNQELASSLQTSHLAMTPQEEHALKHILDTLQDVNSNFSSDFSSTHYQLLSKLQRWPLSKLFPILDILRLAILHPRVAEHYAQQHALGQRFLDDVIIIREQQTVPEANRMIALKFVTNMFVHSPLRIIAISQYERIFAFCGAHSRYPNKTIRAIAANVLLNYAVVFGEASKSLDEPKLAVLRLLHDMLQAEEEHAILYALFVSLGTLIYDNVDAIRAAQRMNFASLVDRWVEASSGSSPSPLPDLQKVQEAAQEVRSLFRWCPL
ncbi:Deubiquitinating protein VCIP135 [Balamuthia mandrillaris]